MCVSHFHIVLFSKKNSQRFPVLRHLLNILSIFFKTLFVINSFIKSMFNSKSLNKWNRDDLPLISDKSSNFWEIWAPRQVWGGAVKVLWLLVWGGAKKLSEKFFSFLLLILLEDIFYKTAFSLGLILRKCTVRDRKYMSTRKIIWKCR